MGSKRTALGFGVLALVTTALLVVFGGTSGADAQLAESVTLSFGSQTLEDTEPFVAHIGFDAGTNNIGAMKVLVDFDSTALEATACSTEESGACNITDGQVVFAVLGISGFESNDSMFAVDFRPIDTSATAEVAVSIATIATTLATELDQAAQVQSGFIEWVDANGSITGEVLDGISGAGFYGGSVCLSNADQEICTSTSGLGNYRFDDLVSGTYTLVISDADGLYESVTQIVDVVSPGIVTGLDARLQPAAVPFDESVPVVDPLGYEPPGAVAAIHGTVTDSTGNPVFGVQVCATMPVILTQACAYTTATGDYQITGLDSGNYVVTASDPAQRFQASSDPVVVGITATTGADVDLAVQ